jgi:hypothetical protein
MIADSLDLFAQCIEKNKRENPKLPKGDSVLGLLASWPGGGHVLSPALDLVSFLVEMAG